MARHEIKMTTRLSDVCVILCSFMRTLHSKVKVPSMTENNSFLPGLLMCNFYRGEQSGFSYALVGKSPHNAIEM